MGWHITVTDVVRFIVLYMVLPLFTNVLEVGNSRKLALGLAWWHHALVVERLTRFS
jgi:hypothetical protein